LVIQVVPVGEHYDRRVLHRGLANDAACVERHRQTLARPLRVPHHAHAPVAWFTARLLPRLVAPGCLRDAVRTGKLRRAQRLYHGYLHRMELVVTRYLLDESPAAVVLEDNE